MDGRAETESSFEMVLGKSNISHSNVVSGDGFYAIRYSLGHYSNRNMSIEETRCALYDRFSKTAIFLPSLSNFLDVGIGIISMMLAPNSIEFTDRTYFLEDYLTGKTIPKTKEELDAEAAKHGGHNYIHSGFLAEFNYIRLDDEVFNGIRSAMSEAKRQKEILGEKEKAISEEFGKLKEALRAR